MQMNLEERRSRGRNRLRCSRIFTRDWWRSVVLVVLMFSRPSNCSFRLYVSARSASSLRAIDTVRLLVRADDVFEVIDVAEHPERAEADRVLATPMLLKLEPLPRQRVIGDLLDLGRLRQALGLEQRESAG